MITLEKFSKHYNKTYAIKKVNLHLYYKETITIIEPSGGGKSTLLRILNNLEEPTSGNLLIDGKKLFSKNCKIKVCNWYGLSKFEHFPAFHS